MTCKTIRIGLFLGLTITFFGCGAYSFTGISIDSETKTFQVNYFQNTANLIEPGIERDFTLALQDIILNQTNAYCFTSHIVLFFGTKCAQKYRVRLQLAFVCHYAFPMIF